MNFEVEQSMLICIKSKTTFFFFFPCEDLLCETSTLAIHHRAHRNFVFIGVQSSIHSTQY